MKKHDSNIQESSVKELMRAWDKMCALPKRSLNSKGDILEGSLHFLPLRKKEALDIIRCSVADPFMKYFTTAVYEDLEFHKYTPDRNPKEKRLIEINVLIKAKKALSVSILTSLLQTNILADSMTSTKRHTMLLGFIRVRSER
jgi:hypothetical protein